MIYRFIAPDWLIKENPDLPKVIEGEYDIEEVRRLNITGYNVYYFPNSPTSYTPNGSKYIDGKDIDHFSWVFVDMDLKDGVYKTKDEFIDKLYSYSNGLRPNQIIDSGNGIHAYWEVSDLDAKSYLKFQRRLMRFYNTDPAVSKLAQLMRKPDTVNTKDEKNQKLCYFVSTNFFVWTCEELDKLLPPITLEDEQYCETHYNQTYGIATESTYQILQKMPEKWGKLLKQSAEAKELFVHTSGDRSDDDFRLALLMQANDFNKDEAFTVLMYSGKGMQRAPHHRENYAKNIIDKIWKEETTTNNSYPTVRELLNKEDTVKGSRFPCHKLVDDTEYGFRLGQVIGIIGGAGVGKTTLTLNMFLWWARNNPTFHHFFFSLEQPAREIADRIRTICGSDTNLFDYIHIISNYGDNGEYHNFSMASIEDVITEYTKTTGNKVGTAVIDHIGVLDKKIKNGEQDGLIGVCREMKRVAVRTNTMVVMLSQAPREKAGIGDLELDKSAAYGTVFFEAFCDYIMCLWQPLKRVYFMGAPTVMSFKFAKIRHKRQGIDKIQEDERYHIFFEPKTERLRELTMDEEMSMNYFMNQAISARNKDRKTDLVPYVSRRVDGTGTSSSTN